MSQETYIAIALNSFLAGSVVSNDVFIQIEENNFIKLWKKGQTFDKSRLDRYTDKKIETVFIANKDFNSYAATCLRMGEVIAGRKGLPPLGKLKIINQIASNVLASFSTLGFDDQAFRQSESLVNSVVTSLEESMELEALIKSLENMGDEFVKNSLAVSSVSIMLSQCMGWKSQRTLKMLGLAGLFHDIGFKELPNTLFLKRRADMTSEEVKLYESHPERGAKILQSLPSIPAEVINIVRDHHEESSGLGFPRGLKLERIFPLSRVIFISEKLVDQLLPSIKNTTPKAPKEAITLLLNLYQRDLKPEMIKGLHKLGKMEYNQ